MQILQLGHWVTGVSFGHPTVVVVALSDAIQPIKKIQLVEIIYLVKNGQLVKHSLQVPLMYIYIYFGTCI